MRSPIVLLMFVKLMFAAGAFGQDATVTFYSAGSVARALLHAEATFGVRSHPPFCGFVFDGDRRLGLMQGGRFMTVHVPAGPHIFARASIGSSRRPATRATLTLTAEAGRQYFVQLAQTDKGFSFVQLPFQRLDRVDCETARKEASRARPVGPKRVDKEFRASLDTAAEFPACRP